MMAKKCSPMLTMYPYSHTSSNKFAPFNSLYKASKNTPQNSMCDHQITVLAPNGYEQLGPMEEKSTNHEIRSPECFNDYLVVKVGVLLSQASSKTASIRFQTILFPKNKPKLKLKRTPTRTPTKTINPSICHSCHFVVNWLIPPFGLWILNDVRPTSQGTPRRRRHGRLRRPGNSMGELRGRKKNNGMVFLDL